MYTLLLDSLPAHSPLQEETAETEGTGTATVGTGNSVTQTETAGTRTGAQPFSEYLV